MIGFGFSYLSKVSDLLTVFDPSTGLASRFKILFPSMFSQIGWTSEFPWMSTITYLYSRYWFYIPFRRSLILKCGSDFHCGNSSAFVCIVNPYLGFQFPSLGEDPVNFITCPGFVLLHSTVNLTNVSGSFIMFYMICSVGWPKLI